MHASKITESCGRDH